MKFTKFRILYVRVFIICSSFNDTVSDLEYMASDNQTGYNELEEMWKEAVVAYFAEIFRHFPGRFEEGHEPQVRTVGLLAEISRVKVRGATA
jgi:hypothetical protein